MGGKSAPAPPPPPPGPDWGAIMAAERKANQRQFDIMRKDSELARQREETRRLEEEARREQERRTVTQMEKDRAARAQADAAAQAAAAQATGTTSSAAMPKFTQAAQSAPGLAPMPPSQTATRFGNIFYSPAAKLGGS